MAIVGGSLLKGARQAMSMSGMHVLILVSLAAGYLFGRKVTKARFFIEP
jgi:hypothetical protein